MARFEQYTPTRYTSQYMPFPLELVQGQIQEKAQEEQGNTAQALELKNAIDKDLAPGLQTVEKSQILRDKYTNKLSETLGKYQDKTNPNFLSDIRNIASEYQRDFDVADVSQDREVHDKIFQEKIKDVGNEGIWQYGYNPETGEHEQTPLGKASKGYGVEKAKDYLPDWDTQLKEVALKQINIPESQKQGGYFTEVRDSAGNMAKVFIDREGGIHKLRNMQTMMPTMQSLAEMYAEGTRPESRTYLYKKGFDLNKIKSLDSEAKQELISSIILPDIEGVARKYYTEEYKPGKTDITKISDFDAQREKEFAWKKAFESYDKLDVAGKQTHTISIPIYNTKTGKPEFVEKNADIYEVKGDKLNNKKPLYIAGKGVQFRNGKTGELEDAEEGTGFIIDKIFKYNEYNPIESKKQGKMVYTPTALVYGFKARRDPQTNSVVLDQTGKVIPDTAEPVIMDAKDVAPILANTGTYYEGLSGEKIMTTGGASEYIFNKPKTIDDGVTQRGYSVGGTQSGDINLDTNPLKLVFKTK